MGTLSYIGRRLLATLPVMLMVAVVVFAMLRLTPGDPAAILAGDDATGAQLEKVRQTMGLDKSIPAQFASWMGQLMRGDLGVSLLSGTPVRQMIGIRMGPTLALALCTIALTIMVALPLGVIAASQRGRWLDRLVMTLSALGFSVPTFVVAYLLIYLFSMKMGWFPVQGYKPLAEGIWPFAQRLVLPALALSGIYIALVARITRSSILEVMGEDFIRTVRAKGAKDSTILLRHALRNAAVSIVTIIGIGVASLITGVVVTESVFNLPGLGRLVVEAVLARDYPVIQGLILLFSFSYILINLLVDVLYTVLDPRIRY
ncbi:ABC transporter permease [Verminephrobacter eiseniae]|uniref:Binding-protein-dependent transport systems inner membrane component n=1 Tax=Verminephrobacter eiseniae (strain EF01-2) TaxID=391735 RepID=A1WJE8_VEREI|nr:ABC transporter permease [Verminephrobacter eiseniae]KAB7598129.1 ABC transporter permease [Verminephrobacter sp. Larva24]ABM57755.1 binding-protein-dependent transport systems inner membrane component [Verminephrobacter eiseniae EF01-2]MCW5229817.1 ABC transporter permease [Verminephrobacter eiseniae]MCW5283367.1 ABC transporter permease [Verminephrobacter eiseniae]MCW5291548.1 ABC transporter permease [Verminephrobacter eiseniae]